jgi:hypothetical protein
MCLAGDKVGLSIRARSERNANKQLRNSKREGVVQSSFSSSRVAPRSVLAPRPSPELPAPHETVIGPGLSVPRFPRVSGVSALRTPRWPQIAFQWRCVPEPSIGSELCGVPWRSVASASQSSPRVVLAPVVQVWRRAAAAKKSFSIAQRLSRHAAGRPRQQLQ